MKTKIDDNFVYFKKKMTNWRGNKKTYKNWNNQVEFLYVFYYLSSWLGMILQVDTSSIVSQNSSWPWKKTKTKNIQRISSTRNQVEKNGRPVFPSMKCHFWWIFW